MGLALRFQKPAQSCRQVAHRQARRRWSIVLGGMVVAAGFGVVAAKLVAGGLSALHFMNPASWPGGIVLFPLILVVPAIIRWPRAALIGLLAGTTVVDQFQYTIGPVVPYGPSYKGPINIPLFRSLTKGSFVTPVEIITALLLVVFLMKGAHDRNWHVPRSALAKSIAALLVLAVVLGLGSCLAHHGDFNEALWQLRPWYFVASVYLLTSYFFAGRDMFKPLLWTIVIGSGAKSVEGVINYFTIAVHLTPRPDAILSHEESFFFALFLLTAAALWLFQIRGRLRTVATLFAPLVVIADLGNSRRTASLLIYAGLATLLVIAFVSMPERRRVLKKINALVLIGAVVYLSLFWNDGGTLGQPARAIHSAIAPSARDLSSDEYRVIENDDLELNIHQNRSIGTGYGRKIDYVYSIVNLTGIDTMIAYVPHDGVLDMWLRLGILGEMIMWAIMGFAILAGCELAKSGDRRSAVLGTIAVCAVISYALMAYNDLGFSWLRIAVFMGFLFGALEVEWQGLSRGTERKQKAVGGTTASDNSGSVSVAAGFAPRIIEANPKDR